MGGAHRSGMSGAISSIKLIFVGIFFILCIATWGYQVLWVWPKQRCEQSHGWFDPKSRECGRVIYIPNITGRVPGHPEIHGLPRQPAPAAAQPAQSS
jgi:hypothetical protein